MDLTAKQPSERCNGDRTATAGLYETLHPSEVLVFQDVRIVTMLNENVLERRDVAVRDGRIESVRPTGSEWPANSVIIDGRGKTLIPGLADVHAHPLTTYWAALFEPLFQIEAGDSKNFVLPYDLMLFQLLACGITRLEVLAGDPDTLWMRDQVRAGTLAGPRWSVPSPQIDGVPPLAFPPVSWIVTDRAGGERAAAMIAEVGFDFAKTYSRLSKEAYEGLMAGCERLGIRVMGHVPIEVGLEAAIERGQRGIAHAGELFYNLQGDERTNPERLERLARLMADNGVWLQSTISAMHRMESRFDQGQAPDIAWMNPLHSAVWSPDSPVVQAALSDDHSHYYDRTYELSCLSLRIARAAGVSVLSGTDYPAPYIVEGFSLHEELLRLNRDCGFSSQDALASSSRLVAAYLGEDANDGCIAEGGRAHLVLIEGDPLTDIACSRMIDTVLVERTLLRRTAIHEGLNRIKLAYAQMPQLELRGMTGV